MGEVPALLGVQEQRERLDGLPEPHVVGENAAEPGLPERREPLEPALLIGPQLCEESRGQRPWRQVEGPQRLDALAPRLGAGELTEVGDLLPQGHLETTEPNAVGGRGIVELPGFEDQVPEALQVGVVEAEPRARVQDHRLVTVSQRLEQRLERHVLVVDSHDDPQIEPVVILVAGHDIDRRRLGDLVVGRQFVVHEDADPRVGLELGQGCQGKGGGLDAAQRHVAGQPPVVDAATAGQARSRMPRARDGVEDVERADEGLLGRGVAQAAGGPVIEPDHDAAPEVVAEGEVELESVTGTGAHIHGHHDQRVTRRIDGAVAGSDPDGSAQSREEQSAKALGVGSRHDEREMVEGDRAQGVGEDAGEATQPQHLARITGPAGPHPVGR